MTGSTVTPTGDRPAARPARVGYVAPAPSAVDALAARFRSRSRDRDREPNRDRDRDDRPSIELETVDARPPVELADDALDRFDCLVIGTRLEWADRLAALERLRTARDRLPIFLVTAARDESRATAALEAGADGCLPRASVTEGDRLAIRVRRAIERTRERRALEVATVRFRAFTENASFAVVTADDDGTIRYANDAVETILGYEPDDVVGEPLTTLVPPSYRDDHRAAIDRYRRTGERRLDWDWIELPGRRADGRDVPLGISFGEARVDGERLFTAVMRDLTDRRELERERETILDRIADAFVSIDEDWTYTYVNDRAVELLGRSREELLGTRIWDAFPTLVDTDTQARLEEAFSEQTVTTFTAYFPSLGNWFEVRVYPSEDGLSIFFTDVTDRIRAEEDLEANVMALQTLYDVSTQTDASLESKLREVLELGCEYFDLPYGFLTRIDTESETQTILQARGDHPSLQSGESCPLSEAYCRKTIEAPDLVTASNAPEEGWIGDPAYETFELGSYIGAKVTVDGAIWGTLCFAASDPREGDGFTEPERTLVKLMAKWVSYETERERSRAELERQNGRLQEFASVVSHDLRNPLNVAQGALELAADRDAAAETREAQLAECERALDRMERLIDDLLTLAEQGSSVDGVKPVSLADVARTAWSMVDTDELVLEVEDERRLLADPDRLQQLFENLFRNAVEHGFPDGADTEFTVFVGSLEREREREQEPEGDPSQRSQGRNPARGFYVEDTGRGIPPDERDRVFQAGHTTAVDGTGFGLSIVNRIVEAHGWEIEATDGRDGGARFEIADVASPN